MRILIEGSEVWDLDIPATTCKVPVVQTMTSGCRGWLLSLEPLARTDGGLGTGCRWRCFLSQGSRCSVRSDCLGTTLVRSFIY